jgi:hypothetical protein
MRCRRKFLRFFPGGFADETYNDWERGYKWTAHERWMTALAPATFRTRLREGQYAEVAAHAVSIESRTNLLFSFEKMALRDAVKPAAGAEAFATGLYELLHGRAGDERRFENWCEVVGSLPRRQTRVLTWPVVTVFGFIAQPDRHMFLKPNVTRVAAELDDVREPARLRDARARRPAGSRAAGHDRRPVVHLGTGFGRVRGVGGQRGTGVGTLVGGIVLAVVGHRHRADRLTPPQTMRDGD